jgi:circadian clock protein KaiC
VDAYIGPSGVLTGSARAAQTAREEAEALASQQEASRRKRELGRKRVALERQISGLRSEHEAGDEELRRIDEQVGMQTRLLTTGRTELGRLRQADVSVAASASRKLKLK